ncbi:MAG: ABC transporter permease [Planctomycetota bacterium]|jgi:ABC-type lipoprotein release transport system permease subunit
MYKIILATRYLVKRRITYLAVTAVALCVFMVVVVMTVMTGLVRDFKTKNHDWVGDCVVSSDSLVGFAYYEEFLEALKGEHMVEAASPVVNSYALLTYGGSDWNESIEIMGIDPLTYCRATGFGRTLHYRKDDVSRVFEPMYDVNLPGCVVGIDKVLSRNKYGQYQQHQTVPGYSYTINCFPLTARGALVKTGLGLVNSKTFYYSDNSHSGLAKVDGAFIYIPFEDAQLLCGMGGAEKRVSSIHIKFKSGVGLQDGCERIAQLWTQFRTERSGRKLSYLLSSVRIESWKEYRREVIAAVEKEQIMMMVGFGMIGIITVFIVLVVFYMIVSHKSKDIGILRSLGVLKTDVVGLFLSFAALLGLLGSCIGTFVGWLFLLKINDIEDWLLEKFEYQPLWDRTIFAIEDIPNQVEFEVLAAIIISAILACLVGALIPSWQAARLRPVDTLQVSRL